MNKFSLRTDFPQNFFIRKPLLGSLILLIFGLVFLIIYRPLRTHPSPGFDFRTSMAIYLLFASAFAYVSIRLLKRIKYFKNENDWTILKEILAVFIVIQMMGIGVYLCGFLLDNLPSGNRWSFSVFFDSCSRVFLIEIFPFGFSSFFAYLRLQKPKHQQKLNVEIENKGQLILIESSLKKESLQFFESEFLFAEADANYVIFHLFKEGKLHKTSIRNSISKIEKQLSETKSFFRTHRAFIINLNQIESKRGNALGYQLSLKNSDLKVPVSRQNIKAFDILFKP